MKKDDHKNLNQNEKSDTLTAILPAKIIKLLDPISFVSSSGLDEGSMIEKLISDLSVEQKHNMVQFIVQLIRERGLTEYTETFLDSFINEIDTMISAQMDEILHHNDFQSVESIWRGLHYLVKNTEFSSTVKFEILDVSKKELFEDLYKASHGEGYEKESAFWNLFFWPRFAQVDEHPYTVIIADFLINNTEKDVELLQHLSVLCEAGQVALIAGVSASFFGEDDLGMVMKNRHLIDDINGSTEFEA